MLSRSRYLFNLGTDWQDPGFPHPVTAAGRWPFESIDSRNPPRSSPGSSSAPPYFGHWGTAWPRFPAGWARSTLLAPCRGLDRWPASAQPRGLSSWSGRPAGRGTFHGSSTRRSLVAQQSNRPNQRQRSPRRASGDGRCRRDSCGVDGAAGFGCRPYHRPHHCRHPPTRTRLGWSAPCAARRLCRWTITVACAANAHAPRPRCDAVAHVGAAPVSASEQFAPPQAVRSSAAAPPATGPRPAGRPGWPCQCCSDALSWCPTKGSSVPAVPATPLWWCRKRGPDTASDWRTPTWTPPGSWAHHGSAVAQRPSAFPQRECFSRRNAAETGGGAGIGHRFYYLQEEKWKIQKLVLKSSNKETLTNKQFELKLVTFWS